MEAVSNSQEVALQIRYLLAITRAAVRLGTLRVVSVFVLGVGVSPLSLERTLK